MGGPITASRIRLRFSMSRKRDPASKESPILRRF